MSSIRMRGGEVKSVLASLRSTGLTLVELPGAATMTCIQVATAVSRIEINADEVQSG